MAGSDFHGDGSRIDLRALLPEDERAFRRFAREYAAAGDHRYAAALDDFSAYRARTARSADPAQLLIGGVPGRYYWLFCDGELVAASRLRLELTEELKRLGGNIGYDVRPSERSRGFGTRVLYETLREARSASLERVLITCDSDNPGSRRVIEKNGGALIDRGLAPVGGRPTLGYWIDLAVALPAPLPLPRPLEVRTLGDFDRADVDEFLQEHFPSTTLVSCGRVHPAGSLEGIVCRDEGRLLGLALYRPDGERLELVALAVDVARRGIGRRLIAEVAEHGDRTGARAVWLVTTDNNEIAQRFYLACGFRMVAVHEGAVAEARKIRPTIPTHDELGRPIRDEIEYDLKL